jgi:hypothetical protein
MNAQDELRDLWHCGTDIQPGKRGEEMLALVIEKTRSFDRQIAVRNALECIAAAFVVCMFGWFAVTAPNQIVRAGMTIVALSGIWIVYYILRYGGGPKRLDPGMDLSVYNRLLRENYEQQIRVLRRVKYWYLLPPYIGIVIGNIGVWFQQTSEGHNSGARLANLLGLVFVTLIFGAIWILNERYGVRHLERLKRELLALDEGQKH